MKSRNDRQFVNKTVYGLFFLLVTSSSDFKRIISSEAGKEFVEIIKPLRRNLLLFPYNQSGIENEKRKPVFVSRHKIDVADFLSLWSNEDLVALMSIEMDGKIETKSVINILVMGDDCSYPSILFFIRNKGVKWVPFSKYLFERYEKNAKLNKNLFDSGYGSIQKKIKDHDLYSIKKGSRTHEGILPWREYGDDRYALPRFLTVGKTRRSIYRIGPNLGRSLLKGLQLDPKKRRAEKTPRELNSLFITLGGVHKRQQSLYALRWRELMDLYRIIVKRENVETKGLFIEHLSHYPSVYHLYMAVKGDYQDQLISFDIGFRPIELSDENEDLDDKENPIERRKDLDDEENPMDRLEDLDGDEDRPNERAFGLNEMDQKITIGNRKPFVPKYKGDSVPGSKEILELVDRSVLKHRRHYRFLENTRAIQSTRELIGISKARKKSTISVVSRLPKRPTVLPHEQKREWPVEDFLQGRQLLMEIKEEDRINMIQKAQYRGRGHLFRLLGIGTAHTPSYVNPYNPANVIKEKVMYLKHYDKYYYSLFQEFKKRKKAEKKS